MVLHLEEVERRNDGQRQNHNTVMAAAKPRVSLFPRCFAIHILGGGGGSKPKLLIRNSGSSDQLEVTEIWSIFGLILYISTEIFFWGGQELQVMSTLVLKFVSI